jgi:hypothetical protein
VILDGCPRVAQDLRPYVQVCRHADLLQQASVIGLRGGLTVDAEAFGQARGDEGAAQAMLEVEPHGEVGGERERGDQLGREDPLLTR